MLRASSERMTTNPTTKVKFLPREMATKNGVYIDTDGRANFATEKEVTLWRFIVEKMGLSWAMHRFFDRKDFPKIK